MADIGQNPRVAQPCFKYDIPNEIASCKPSSSKPLPLHHGNYALSIEGIVFAAVFIDRGMAVKISFRSVGAFSVNEFARQNFNGGGHHNASGGISHEPLTATVQRFLDLLPAYQTQLVSAPLAVTPPTA